MNKKLACACTELLKYSKSGLTSYIERFNRVGDNLEAIKAELEKVERELDTYPHSEIILLGLKRKIDEALKDYYSIDFQINWVLEDVLKVIETGD